MTWNIWHVCPSSCLRDNVFIRTGYAKSFWLDSHLETSGHLLAVTLKHFNSGISLYYNVYVHPQKPQQTKVLITKEAKSYMSLLKIISILLLFSHWSWKWQWQHVVLSHFLNNKMAVQQKSLSEHEATPPAFIPSLNIHSSSHKHTQRRRKSL